jgi:outer membrane protein assembly factor BamB
MRRALSAVLLVALAPGCGAAGRHDAAPATTRQSSAAPRARPAARQRSRPRPPGRLPGDLLIADRDNGRIVLVSPAKRVVWENDHLRGPDDAFFTPGDRSIVTNEEFNDTITELSFPGGRTVWRYGHDAVPGASAGYLDRPDDAYRLSNGLTTVADILNCRIVELARSGRVVRSLGGSCVHDPPRGFAGPNGDTPLADGGLLVTEIGGWIDRLGPDGRLRWSVRSPVPYPSDAQLLPDGKILVAGFTDPGKVVELTTSGRVTWSFGAPSGPNRLNKPSLAVRLPNGLLAVTDDWNDRVLLVDPHTRRIVWQYGHTGVPSRAAGYLSKPDGLDLLPAAVARRSALGG